MHLPVTVRTQSRNVLNRIRSTVCQGDDVMNLKIRFPIGITERCFPAKLTDPACTVLCRHGNMSISGILGRFDFIAFRNIIGCPHRPFHNLFIIECFGICFFLLQILLNHCSEQFRAFRFQSGDQFRSQSPFKVVFFIISIQEE